MSKILITGGAGFIGSQLSLSLKKDGHHVTIVDNMSYGYEDNLFVDDEPVCNNFVNVDIRSKQMFAEMSQDIDYIYHFAGISSLPVCQSNPYEAIDVNTAGTAQVLEAARCLGAKRVIFASTSAIYENDKSFPNKEADDSSPDLIYSMSKLQAEMICKSYYENYGLEVVILRYHNVYGPHQDYRRKSPPFVGYVLKNLIQEKPIVLHSDGTQKRDYVYVDDVIEINKICMTHPDAPGNIFNVASGKSYSVNEIYSEISKHFKKIRFEPEFDSADKFWNKYPDLFLKPYAFKKNRIKKEVNKFTLGSNFKAKQILGWEPKINLQEGMKKVVQFAVEDSKKPSSNRKLK